MKRLIASLLLVAMLIACFAGCANDATPGETQAPNPTDASVVTADENIANAAAYLKNIYKNVTEATPADFERVASVPVGTAKYDIEWSVDVSEEFVKIVNNGDGKVIIDVNEESAEEVTYVLTATLTGTDGTKQTLSWTHKLPAALGEDMSAILDLAYALEDGQSLPNTATLTGVITKVDTPYSADYKNVTVTIAVPGCEDRPVQCYRLKGEGADTITIGDTITVTGTLKNYKGTIEFDAGCTLDKVVKGEGSMEIPTDPAEIMELAYQLKPGESLPYNVTLTGKIHSINSGYSKQYGNISVAMKVEGSDRSIECFRLKGEGVENLSINDVITVTGSITNYKGTIEFNAGCTLDSYIDFDAPQQPKDSRKVLETVKALWEGGTLNYTATLTGVITKIETAWSDYYGNITVVMVVDGHDDIPVTCFRIKGEGAEDLKVGDTITVRGSMMNYYGKVEFKAGSLVIDIVKGEASEEEKPEVVIPPAGSTLSIADAYALGDAMDHNTTTDGKYYVTGTIKKISSTTWGNMTITDGNGNELYIYGTYDEDGNRYDAMDPQPQVGDTITLYGVIGNFYGAQMKNATIIADEEDPEETEPEETEPEETEPEETEPEETEPEVEIPAAGSTLSVAQAAALGASMEHDTTTDGKYYVTGTIQSIKNSDWGNMTITDNAGNTLYIYGTYDADGNKFGEMENPPAVGDTVTLYGVIGNFYGAQMKNAVIQ